MSIAVGDPVPDVTVKIPTPDGPKDVQTAELLGSGKAVLFGVPGAFTPTCSDYHLPGFVLRADELEAKGVDTVACLSVNDAFVMGAWGDAQEVGQKVVLLADGSAELTRALGLEIDLSGGGLGIRSKRFALIAEDGVVTDVAVEEGLGLEVSSVDAVLAKL
jgi:peroxiredoxin (alkyl hydroperoxide reductase subunit C)